MSAKVVYICSIVVSFLAMILVVIFAPHWLSDSNGFMKKFMTHEILNIFGVILAITLASAAQIHLEFNRLEERWGSRKLEKARDEIKQGSIFLVIVFGLSVVLLILKSILDSYERLQAGFNGFLLLLLLANMFTLLDMLNTVFVIKSQVNNNG